MNTDTQIEEKISIDIKIPKKWKVVFHNDDQTPMDFVISLLIAVFKHSQKSAEEITLEIHNTGCGIAGIYSHEVAEQKAIESTTIAKGKSYPLSITIEEDD